jgi:DNA transformation protein and related proteins
MDSEAIKDLFADFGPVRTRKMFGGQGIYSGDRMIAMEVKGEIWIKADANSRAVFEAAGSSPFLYPVKDGKIATIPYWRLPDAALDDPAELTKWAQLGLQAALRASTKKK